MRRTGRLKEAFLSFENLYSAFKKAFKGTKNYAAFQFAFQAERELFRLREELAAEAYIPGDYHYFKIHDPKERVISVAPFRDRVVHHALVNILEPIYEKRFIYDSYATRKNKGAHKAIQRAQQFLKSNRWYLKMDIRKYFDSINHLILLATLQRTIKDAFILRLCEKIITKGGDGTTGLPIGNLTSQFFANVYLDLFDHYIKENLRVKCYLRYMDDFCLFSNEKETLIGLRNDIEAFLAEKLILIVKTEATLINTRLHGLSFLGVRIFPALVRIRRENFKRSYQRLKMREWEYALGYIGDKQYDNSMQSLISHLNHWGNNLLKGKLYKGAVS